MEKRRDLLPMTSTIPVNMIDDVRVPHNIFESKKTFLMEYCGMVPP